ncbi:MAG TPA: Xaa-Pro peptidase family protein [Armatimonadota bacterium]|nr:Xaa-Pro peptidase family protein [Armatimonadota bacterium]
MIESRLDTLRQWMAGEGLDAFVVSSHPNVRYLTGFTGEGILVVFEELAICTDSRYTVQAAEEAPELETTADEGGHVTGAGNRLAQSGATRAGFEADMLTYAGWEKLAAGAGEVELVPTHGIVVRQRAVKDPSEVDLIRRAVAVADAAFDTLASKLQPGMVEREAALQLDLAMVMAGAEKPAFETILAAGPNGAKPHARPGTRELAEGDLVVVDWGATVDGYCSDCTRTVIIGEPDQRQREVWRAVREAQLAALEAAGPGVPCRDVDAAARNLLDDRGLAELFGHGVGHGVGLQVHEQPRLSASSDDVLEPGMVVTIEPAVYVEGWGGVRLEELILIAEEGIEVLTRAPYAL